MQPDVSEGEREKEGGLESNMDLERMEGGERERESG